MTTDTHSDRSEHSDAPDPSAHDVHPHSGHDDQHHWTDLQYVQLALGLAIITALEVLLSYTKDSVGGFFMPALLIMMAIKFFAVVFYFMHLKFDNRLFGLLFYTGLLLAVGVYCAALLTFQFFSP
jgi:cytochrome c oxidase subunit IV